jgi:hypothetical protein
MFVDEGVHLGHGEGGVVELLPVELQWGRLIGQPPMPVVLLAVGLQQAQVGLDEQAARATGRIVNRLTGLWI